MAGEELGCGIVVIIALFLVAGALGIYHGDNAVTYPPLNELNPKARYVMIDDDDGHHVKLDKTYIKSIYVVGSDVYIHYGGRNVWIITYPDDSRRQEMCQRILRWWKAG